MKISITFFILAAISISVLYGQQQRVRGLGGMNLISNDKDYELNPFDFGDNPGYLMLDEKETHLRINPSLGFSWGDMRRAYDSEGKDIYGINFRGIKALGEKGTFLGYTSYNHEIRKDYNRTLTYDPYGGESFFVRDTTSGDYRYSGPRINIQYSFPFTNELYLGVSTTYQLLDGLKSVYTNAQTIYREVDVTFGMVYMPLETFIAGAKAGYADFQETIEAKDVNLLEVEIFNYRGDTYFIKQRGSSETQKIRKRRLIFGGQMFYQYGNIINVGLQGNYYPSNSKILIPQSGFIDVEEGYASFDSYDLQGVVRMIPFKNTTAGVSFGYYSRDSWSRNSKLNLTLWEWNTNEITGGGGIAYKVESIDLLLGGEIEFRQTKTDSLKHIDNRYVNDSFSDVLIKTGGEIEVLKDTYIRGGFNYGTKGFDLVTGGKDVTQMLVTFGVGYPLLESLYIDAYFEYGKQEAKESSYKVYNDKVSRSILNGMISLRLNSF